MAYGAFGDIRALLHAPPSMGTWEKLCAEVRLWREPELSQVVFPYVLSQLERWPDDLRVIRPAWSKDLLRGRARGAHFTAMARRLEVEDVTPDRAQWDNLSHLDWRSLRHLRLNHVKGPGELLTRLHAASITSSLRSIHLGGGDLTDTIGEQCALGSFEHLGDLRFVGSTPSEDDLLELSVASWPNLHTLAIRHMTTSTLKGAMAWSVRSLEPLTSELHAPELRRVDLATLDHELDVAEEILRAAWLPQLTHLSLNGSETRTSYSSYYGRRFPEAFRQANLSSLERLSFFQLTDAATIEALTQNPTLTNLVSVLIERRSGLKPRGTWHIRGIILNSSLPEAVKAEWRA